MGSACRRGLAWRFRPLRSSSVNVAPETSSSLRRQAQHLCRPLTPEIHALFQRVPCGTVGRGLNAAPELEELGKRQRAVQRLRELSQARQPVSGVNLNVEGRHRLGQRRVKCRPHGHAEGSAQERSQLGGSPPLAGPEQPREDVAQPFGLDLCCRTTGQARKRAALVRPEDELGTVGRLPFVQCAHARAPEPKIKPSLIVVALPGVDDPLVCIHTAATTLWRPVWRPVLGFVGQQLCILSAFYW